MRTGLSFGKRLTAAAVLVWLLCLAAGCGAKEEPDAFRSGTEEAALDPDFDVFGEPTLDVFDWAFHPRGYDDSGEVSFENPYSAAGLWEMAVWRRTEKSGTRKELYYVSVYLEAPGGAVLEADPEVYAMQAFKESEEAKAAGIEANDTTKKLMDALQSSIDGSIPAVVRVTLAGIEDNEGNWERRNGRSIRLEGKYFPEHMFLKVEDEKGNEFTANTFVTSGNEQHAEGSFTPARGKAGLLGVVYLWRSIE